MKQENSEIGKKVLTDGLDQVIHKLICRGCMTYVDLELDVGCTTSVDF